MHRRIIGGGLLVSILMGMGLTGCSQGEAEPVDSTQAMVVLFKDPVLNGPRMDIYEVNGHAAITVSGPIGTENDVAPTNGDETFAELYRVIHPSISKVPSELVALDERFSSDFEELRAKTREIIESTPNIEKTQAAFNSTVCKQFREGSRWYTPIECPYRSTPPGNAFVGSGNQISAGDRTYAWNNTSHQMDVVWAHQVGSNDFAWRLQPFWWTWTSLTSGGPYTAAAYVLDSGTATGDWGFTWHSLSIHVG